MGIVYWVAMETNTNSKRPAHILGEKRINLLSNNTKLNSELIPNMICSVDNWKFLFNVMLMLSLNWSPCWFLVPTICLKRACWCTKIGTQCYMVDFIEKGAFKESVNILGGGKRIPISYLTEQKYARFKFKYFEIPIFWEKNLVRFQGCINEPSDQTQWHTMSQKICF